MLLERVDSGLPEQRGNVRSERAVEVSSAQHAICGKMDLLEIETPSAINQKQGDDVAARTSGVD